VGTIISALYFNPYILRQPTGRKEILDQMIASLPRKGGTGGRDYVCQLRGMIHPRKYVGLKT
jgi:hypothetical protein